MIKLDNYREEAVYKKTDRGFEIIPHIKKIYGCTPGISQEELTESVNYQNRKDKSNLKNTTDD